MCLPQKTEDVYAMYKLTDEDLTDIHALARDPKIGDLEPHLNPMAGAWLHHPSRTPCNLPVSVRRYCCCGARIHTQK